MVLPCVFASARAAAQAPPQAPESIAVGDWRFTPSLQLRTRAEVRIDPVDVGPAAAATPGQPPTVVHDQGVVFERARLGIAVDKGPIHAQLTFQDTHVFGATQTAVFTPFEAFAEARTSSARPTWFRLGRQVIELGDGRLLGQSDWSPTPTTLDAARLHVPFGSRFDLDLFGALLDSPRPFGAELGDTATAPVGGDQLYGASLDDALFAMLKLQVYGLAKIARYSTESRARDFATARAVGETYTGSARGFTAHGERVALGPRGRLPARPRRAHHRPRRARSRGVRGRRAREQDLRAGRVDAQRPARRLVRLGRRRAGDDTYKQFDPILPDVHAFYGAMDVFAWSNIVDPNIRVTVAPFPETTVAVEYRYAQMVQANGEWLNGYLQSVGHSATNTSKELGHEIDGVITWSPWSSVSLVAGYSMFALGDGARALLASAGRGDVQSNGAVTTATLSHFAYLQATLRVP